MPELIKEKRKTIEVLGIKKCGQIFWNASTPQLYEEALRRNEGKVSHLGPLVVKTAPHTGRFPKGKAIVREPSCENKIAWGKTNCPFEPEHFDALQKRICNYLENKDLFIQDCYVGAEEESRIALRVISERAIGSLFARIMFIREPDLMKLKGHQPDFTVLHVPDFHADSEKDHTASDAFIIIHFAKRLILIGGTAYAGEIKKSIFTVMNYLLPQKGIMTMHSSANYGSNPDDVAVFFGLSGTGKTTLSASADRTLIGDDEHGWSDRGVFNFEGGCYAKVIKLSSEKEPEIYQTTRRFGTLLENVAMDSVTRRINLYDSSVTENTRASYPITHIENMSTRGVGGHPKNIIMLTCDAFGVLPPVAKLNLEQAKYHFISGYTAKVAGTEQDITKPQATFSPCFGGPFMPLPPAVYAEMLGTRIAKYKVDVWLVNTGWSGGPYGVGKRMDITVTRSLVNAILKGDLKEAKFRQDPVFEFEVPIAVPGISTDFLDPKTTWQSPEDYDLKARELAGMFKKNYESLAQNS